MELSRTRFDNRFVRRFRTGCEAFTPPTRSGFLPAIHIIKLERMRRKMKINRKRWKQQADGAHMLEIIKSMAEPNS